jgi:alpha-ketoglutarate-dependent taurine dioxygenase
MENASATLPDTGSAIPPPPDTSDLGMPMEVQVPDGATDLPSLLDWLTAEAPRLRAAAIAHGAILLRSCPISDAGAFEAVCRAVTPGLLDYTGGGSLRKRVAGKVYNSTEFASDQHLLLHCEASYFRDMPDFIWFYSDIPAASGGETPVGDTAKVLRRLDPDLVARFVAKGLRYLYNLHGGHGFGRGWQAAFDTEDRAVVDAWLAERGMRHAWDEKGGLRIAWELPALRTHPVTGVTTWGNGAANWHAASHAPAIRAAMRRVYREENNFPVHVLFGDGSPIPDEDIHAIIAVLKEVEVAFPWRRGDVMLCDNNRMAHGRRPFKGDRRVLVAMA